MLAINDGGKHSFDCQTALWRWVKFKKAKGYRPLFGRWARGRPSCCLFASPEIEGDGAPTRRSDPDCSGSARRCVASGRARIAGPWVHSGAPRGSCRRFEAPTALAASSVRSFKSKSGTRIIELLVPLGFRSSCQRVLRALTSFGSGARVARQRGIFGLRLNQRSDRPGAICPWEVCSERRPWVGLRLPLPAGAAPAPALRTPPEDAPRNTDRDRLRRIAL